MQSACVDERQHLLVAGSRRLRQESQRLEDKAPLSQRAEREFTKDEWMYQHLLPFEQAGQGIIT